MTQSSVWLPKGEQGDPGPNGPPGPQGPEGPPGPGAQDFADMRNALALPSMAALLSKPTNGALLALTHGFHGWLYGGSALYKKDNSNMTPADGIKYIQTVNGERWQLLQNDLISLRQAGAFIDGVNDDFPAINYLLNKQTVDLSDGVHSISNNLNMGIPGNINGNGARTVLQTLPGFPAVPMLTIEPTVGFDPRGIQLKHFKLNNASGTAQTGILINLTAQYNYVSKIEIQGVLSLSPYNGYFVELLNPQAEPSNIDGLFTCVIQDNWSIGGGYFLDDVGDSVFLLRNTTTGPGMAYYVKQADGASHLKIEGGNCTSAGGIRIVKGLNVTVKDMQCECVVPFTGSDNAYVSVNGGDTLKILKVNILDNNINTHGNVTFCVSLRGTVGAIIDGGTLNCNGDIGAHIFIGNDCEDTFVGPDILYLTNGGAAAPQGIIQDNGIGTRGIWKNAALASWTTLADPTYGFPVGFYKTYDGLILLRGNLTGAPSVPGQTLFTLPVGFRPQTKVYTNWTFGFNGGNNQAALLILPSGEVQHLSAGVTSIYLDGLTFSSK